MNTVQYLDAAKRKLGVESDYALAKALGLTCQAVSRFRNGYGRLGNTTAVKLAEILGVPPMQVIADMELERGADTAVWLPYARRAAVLVLFLAGLAAATVGLDITPVASAGVVAVPGPTMHCVLAAVAAWLAFLAARRGRWWP